MHRAHRSGETGLLLVVQRERELDAVENAASTAIGAAREPPRRTTTRLCLAGSGSRRWTTSLLVEAKQRVCDSRAVVSAALDRESAANRTAMPAELESIEVDVFAALGGVTCVLSVGLALVARQRRRSAPPLKTSRARNASGAARPRGSGHADDA
jgi:hypothetical protein